MKKLWDDLFDHLPLDAAADQLGIKFQHDALPPCLNPSDAAKVVSFLIIYYYYYLYKKYYLNIKFDE